MKKCLITALLLTLLLIPGCKDKSVDYSSLATNKVLIENKIHTILSVSDNDSSNISSLNRFISSAEEDNDYLSIELACRTLGKQLREEAQFYDAIAVHKKGLDAAKKLKDTIEIVHALNNIGTALRRLGEFAEATTYHQKALEISDKYSFANKNDFAALKSKTVALNGLGNISLTMKCYNDAEEYFRECLKIEDSLKSPLGKAINYANIGAIYEVRKQYDSALVYFHHSIEENRIAKSNVGISLNYCSTGSVYEKQGKLQDAKNEYVKSCKIMEHSRDKWHWLASSIALGKVCLKMGSYEEAFLHLSESKKVAENIDAQEYLIEINKGFYEYYLKKGNYKAALEAEIKSSTYSDSVINEKSRNSILESRANYEKELKNKDIAILNQKNIFERNTRIITTFASAAVILLLLVLLTVTLRLSKIRRRRNTELEQINAVKNRIFTIISHDLKNPVAAQQLTLQQMLDFSLLSADDSDVNRAYKQQITGQCKQLIASCDAELRLLQNLFTWAKIETGKMIFNPTRFKLLAVVESTKEVLSVPLEMKELELKTDISRSTILFTDRNIVETVLRNFILNAIKYSYRKGVIVISEHIDGEIVTVSVKDNGKGMPEGKAANLLKGSKNLSEQGTEGEIGTGMGLEVCMKMIAISGEKIAARSSEDKGSVFSFTSKLADYTEKKNRR